MASYLLRKAIRKLPGKVIKIVPIPSPNVTEGLRARDNAGKICRELGYGRCLVVTDKTLYSLGFHEKLLSSLDEYGIEYSLFCDIDSEPSEEIIENGRKAADSVGAECVIALGGGSVLDSCKMICAGCRLKRRKTSSLLKKFLIVRKKTLPLITIPSTAGTGAEITVGAVVTKESKRTKCAIVIVGLNISHVILDSELTLKAPRSVTAACGIDALSHGLEGIIADVKSDEADMKKSMECVKTVLDVLPILLDNPTDTASRLRMCRAAMYGGNAINKQLAGNVHAVAHSIGALYHIPHGNAIALSLLPVMRAQKEKCLDKTAALASYCGISDENDSPKEAADKLLDEIERLTESCGFEKRGHFIPKSDYKTLIGKITNDSINYSAPVAFSKKDIYRILDEINGDN